MGMKCGWNPIHGILALVLPVSMAFAGPVKTVPWNGAPGAVTFTFDDGCSSQLTNVLPALRTRKINATFFVIGNSSFWSNRAAWVGAAQAGDEIANHTVDHTNLTTISDTSKIRQEIQMWADSLRALDTSIQAVTMATPNCAANPTIDAIMNTQNIISRTCSSGSPYSWKTKPFNWMEMQSQLVQDASSLATALSALDNAKKDSGWITSLNHGVGGDWLSMSASDVATMFDRAITNKLWIGTYQDVAAYWRASFTMDTVSAVASAAGSWRLAWTSPHARMPRHVMLKVKLDAQVFGAPGTTTVSQGSAAIPPNADGSYTIDFMKLQLAVTKNSATGVSPLASAPISASLSRQGSELVFAGLSDGAYRLEMRSLSGRLLTRTELLASGTQTRVAIPASLHGCVLAVLSCSGSQNLAVPVWLP